MHRETKILAFAGSARQQSVNKMLVRQAASVAEQQGAIVTTIDLNDFPAPIYNGDFEEMNGVPAPMQRFKSLLASHDAFIIASPDYNGGITPLLLNVLSWASRPEGNEAPNSVFLENPVAIMTASPGGLGGIRAVSGLRDTLADLGCMPIPGFITLGNAFEAFDDNGRLKSAQIAELLTALMARLIAVSAQVPIQDAA